MNIKYDSTDKWCEKELCEFVDLGVKDLFGSVILSEVWRRELEISSGARTVLADCSIVEKASITIADSLIDEIVNEIGNEIGAEKRALDLKYLKGNACDV